MHTFFEGQCRRALPKGKSQWPPLVIICSWANLHCPPAPGAAQRPLKLALSVFHDRDQYGFVRKSHFARADAPAVLLP